MIDNLLLPFIWLLNGILAILYALLEHGMTILMFVPMGYLFIRLPRLAGPGAAAMRPWFLGACVLSVLTSMLAPAPAPVMLVLMYVISSLAARTEKYRPDETTWTVIQGTLLYCLIGLGAAFYAWYAQALSNPPPIGMLVAFALWGYPIGFVAFLVKSLLAHAPTPGGGPQNIYDMARGIDPNRRG